MAESRAYKRLKKLHSKAHWQRFESWSGIGVFDANACKGGKEIWVEMKEVHPPKKLTGEWIVKPKVRKSQVAWEAEKRIIGGGKTFVAIMVGDDLLVVPGYYIRPLFHGVKLRELWENSIPPERIFDV